MSSIERKTLYFEVCGKLNTDAVLAYAREYAQTAGINSIVVASTTEKQVLKRRRFSKALMLCCHSSCRLHGV